MPMLPAVPSGLARLVRVRAGGEGVREVAAGEVRPRRTRVGSARHALEIVGAGAAAARANALGHVVHGVVHWHRALPIVASRRPVDGGGVRARRGPAGPGLRRGRPQPEPAQGPRASPRRGSARSTGRGPLRRRRGEGDALLRARRVRATCRDGVPQSAESASSKAVGTGEERGDVQILPHPQHAGIEGQERRRVPPRRRAPRTAQRTRRAGRTASRREGAGSSADDRR